MIEQTNIFAAAAITVWNIFVRVFFSKSILSSLFVVILFYPLYVFTIKHQRPSPALIIACLLGSFAWLGIVNTLDFSVLLSVN